MPKVKFGQLVQSVSGTLGGVTFASGRRSGVVCNQRRRSVPPAGGAAEWRAHFARVRAVWDAQTDDWRLAWSTWAKNNPWRNVFGAARCLSGWNAFLGFSAQVHSVGGDIGLAFRAPGFGVFQPPVLSSVTASVSGGLTIVVQNWPVGVYQGTPPTPLPMVFEAVWFARHLEFGARLAAGARYLAYTGVRTSALETYTPYNSDLWGPLVEGEQIEVSALWWWPEYYFSARNSLRCTVVA